MKKQMLSLIFVIITAIGFSQPITDSLVISYPGSTLKLGINDPTGNTDTITMVAGTSFTISNIYATVTAYCNKYLYDPSTLRIVEGALLISHPYTSDYTDNVNSGYTKYMIFVVESGNGYFIKTFYVNGTSIVTGIANINHLNLSKLTVFPNPANEEVTVSFNASKEKTNIEVFDIQGRLVMEDSNEREIGSNKVKLNTSGLSSGIYILHAGSEVFKITKM